MALIGGTAASWPFEGFSQQGRRPMIGFMNAQKPEYRERQIARLRLAFEQQGFLDGREVEIVPPIVGSLDEQAQTFNRQKVDVIITSGNLATLAAKAATNLIPIVFNIGGDPVALGLVESLNHPGGHLTGITALSADLEVKRFEIFTELIPQFGTIAVVVNPNSATTGSKIKDLQNASDQLHRPIRLLQIAADLDVDQVISILKNGDYVGVVLTSDNFLFVNSVRLGAEFGAMKLPAISAYHDFLVAGGLASYGPNFDEILRMQVQHAVRILKGEKPSDMPIEQLRQFVFGLNLNAAKSLGLNVPLPLLGRADEVIE